MSNRWTVASGTGPQLDQDPGLTSSIELHYHSHPNCAGFAMRIAIAFFVAVGVGLIICGCILQASHHGFGSCIAWRMASGPTLTNFTHLSPTEPTQGLCAGHVCCGRQSQPVCLHGGVLGKLSQEVNPHGLHYRRGLLSAFANCLRHILFH